MDRPSFKVNIDANRDATKGKSVFLKLPPDSRLKVRIMLPTQDEDMMEKGMIMFPAFNHYQFEEDGEKRAWACLNRHTDSAGACPICQLVKPYITKNSKHGTERQRKTAKEIAQRGRFYIMVLQAGKENEGPKLFALAKSAADQLTDRIAMQEAEEIPYLFDIDQGEWIIIDRKGAGLKTKYRVEGTGVQVSLDELLPTWREDAMEIQETIGLNIADREKLVAQLYECYNTDFPLDEVFAPETV